jgi:HSP20 family protein
VNEFEVFSGKNLTRDHREEAVLTRERIELALYRKYCAEEVSTMPSELIPWRHEMERLKREMNQLYERLLDLGPLRRFDAAWAWVPVIDMSESESHITVHAEIPGMEPNDIEVFVQGNMLTIRGERKQESIEEDKEVYRSERSYGAFERSIRLPANVDPEQSKASYTHGVLRIKLLKVDKIRPKPKKVQISTE